MQRKEWSLSALSVELAVDRRTLGKRLQHVPPVAIQHCGNRIEKKWLLRDVIPYVDGSAAEQQQSGEEDAKEMLKSWCGREMYPALIDSPEFIGLLTGSLTSELGLTKAQTLKAYQLVTMAIMWALSAGFDDEHMKFSILGDSLTRDLSDKSVPELEAYAKEHWPNDA